LSFGRGGRVSSFSWPGSFEADQFLTFITICLDRIGNAAQWGRGKDEGRGTKVEGRGTRDEGRGMKVEGRRTRDKVNDGTTKGRNDERRRAKDEGGATSDERRERRSRRTRGVAHHFGGGRAVRQPQALGTGSLTITRTRSLGSGQAKRHTHLSCPGALILISSGPPVGVREGLRLVIS
jgi:hypothetical protein